MVPAFISISAPPRGASTRPASRPRPSRRPGERSGRPLATASGQNTAPNSLRGDASHHRRRQRAVDQADAARASPADQLSCRAAAGTEVTAGGDLAPISRRSSRSVGLSRPTQLQARRRSSSGRRRWAVGGRLGRSVEASWPGRHLDRSTLFLLNLVFAADFRAARLIFRSGSGANSLGELMCFDRTAARAAARGSMIADGVEGKLPAGRPPCERSR
jgi:hypothetical protein